MALAATDMGLTGISGAPVNSLSSFWQPDNNTMPITNNNMDNFNLIIFISF
jgi:hypothetical protein